VIKKIIKNILDIYLFIPDFLRMVLILVKRSSYKYKIDKVANSQDEELIIVGNGPSLKNDIDQFLGAKGDCFCVNHFADSDWFEKLRPKYYLFLDPYFWSDKTNEEYSAKRAKTLIT